MTGTSFGILACAGGARPAGAAWRKLRDKGHLPGPQRYLGSPSRRRLSVLYIVYRAYFHRDENNS